MDRLSRLRTDRSITRTFARGPSTASSARRSGARRDSRNAFGVKTAGSISPTEAKSPRSTSRRRSQPRSSGGPPAGPIRSRRTPVCPSISSGWLRTPHPERIISLSARPGWLRLYARESIGSWFEQALVARRQEHFVYRAETELDFHPYAFQQAAGLIAYYNRTKFHCLAVSWDEKAGRSLTILSCEGDYPEGRLSFPLEAPIPVGAEGRIRLAVSVDHASLEFAYAVNGEWRRVGPILDASILSDEAGGGEHRSFTGAFVGLVAFGASGGAIPADFRYFDCE